MALPDYQSLQNQIARDNNPIISTPGQCFGLNCEKITKLGTLYYNVLLTLLYVASIVAVLTFIYAGVTYLTAGGETEKTEKAKKMIIGSLIGILIIIAAYTIFKTTIDVVTPTV